MNNLGCNLNWLISGEGPIVAKNSAGNKIILKSNYLNDDGYLKSQMLIKKIKSWIIYNYESLESFSIKFNCPDIFLLEVDEFEYSIILPEIIFDTLKFSGCNLKWVFSNNKDISPYENNTNGNFLKNLNKLNNTELIKFKVENN